MKLSRRSTFAVLGGIALGGGALTIGIGSERIALSDEDLVKAVLERHFGRFSMQREEMAAFYADFLDLEYWRFPPERLALIYGTAERFNLADSLRNRLHGKRGETLEAFERHLLAAFLSQTDFTLRNDMSEPVRYLGDGACHNPFAEFA